MQGQGQCFLERVSYHVQCVFDYQPTSSYTFLRRMFHLERKVGITFVHILMRLTIVYQSSKRKRSGYIMSLTQASPIAIFLQAPDAGALP